MDRSKKIGIYKTLNNNIVKVYYIIATDKPTHNDFTKRYNDALRNQEESEATTFRMLYPFIEGISDGFEYKNVIFYHGDKVPSILESLYASTETVENVDEYLHMFEVGC